jgi:hypothetical protein
MCIGVLNRIKGSSARELVSPAAVPLFDKDVVRDDIPGIGGGDVVIKWTKFLYPNAASTFELTPQLHARDHRAVAQGAQLGPGDLRMDAAA